MRPEAVREALVAAGAALAVGLVLFVFYFMVYRVRRFAEPVGFDAPWYVWRAGFAGSEPLGALGTSARPGHELLAAVLGSLTRTGQVPMHAVLSLVLVPVFALALAAFAGPALGSGRWGWVPTTLVAGTMVGVTRLVGENVANLLNLALVAAGLAYLGRAVAAAAPRPAGPAGRGGSRGVGRGLVGCVALLVAAGLAHWLFLAVFGVVLAGTAVLALPSSLRDRGGGMPPLRTEAGLIGSALAATVALTAVAVGAVLRAPWRDAEVREDPRRYLPKLRTDLSRLTLPLTVPAGLAGAAALWSFRAGPGGPRSDRAGAFGVRVLGAWTGVAAAGVAYGALTLDLPPHRFLALIVAGPLAVALAAAVLWTARGGGRRRLANGPAARDAAARPGRGSIPRWAAAGLLTAALAVPGALSWYRHGPGVWVSPRALAEARVAARYLEGLPAGRPAVFVLGPFGPAGLVSVPLAERTVRMALPPSLQATVHFFPGRPADLLAGRRTVLGGPVDAEIEPYWRDVRRVLPARPPALVLRSLGREQFRAAVAGGATLLAPGVALVRGPRPSRPLRGPDVRDVPGLRAGVASAAALLALLGLAGWGWARFLLGPGAGAGLVATLAPATGAAALIVGALALDSAGLRPGGPGAVVVLAVATLAGLAAAGWGGRMWSLGNR